MVKKLHEEKQMVICVVGLGEIGEAVLRDLSALLTGHNVYGYDISEKRRKELKKKGLAVADKLIKADTYIVSVYATEQVFEAIKNIMKLKHKITPLISVESTVKPGFTRQLKKLMRKNKWKFDCVLFPHRYNPGDPEHRCYNLYRIMSGLNKKSIDRAKQIFWYDLRRNTPMQTMQNIKNRIKDAKNVMIYNYNYAITVYPMEVVELAKPLENALRFIEIAVAEDLKLACDAKGIDFELLREAVNTKFNINLKEARAGIRGKCLSKDAKITFDFFDETEGFWLLEKAILTDAIYTERKK